MSTYDVGWGLACLSRSGGYALENNQYHHDPDSGEGVDIYIVDSGVSTNATRLAGQRLKQCKNLTEVEPVSDTRDHGTKVASLIGSKQFGVAKKANLWPYKVIAEQPGQVGAAIDDIVLRNRDNRAHPGYKGAVINLSLTFESLGEMCGEALQRAEREGISIVVAAGNDGIDLTAVIEPSCLHHFVQHAIVVGAIDELYSRAQYAGGGASNRGSRIDIWAPGQGLTGVNNAGRVVVDIEGTSFACAYVSGLVAIFYGEEGISMHPMRAKALLLHNAEVGVIRGLDPASPNLLANNGYLKAQKAARVKQSKESEVRTGTLANSARVRPYLELDEA